MQLKDEMSMLHISQATTGRARWSCACRLAAICAAARHHNQSGVSIFAHCRGAHCVPKQRHRHSRLAAHAIRCDDPVLYLEHKHLYRQTYNKNCLSGRGLHDSVRQGITPPRRHRHGGADVGRWCSVRCSPPSRRKGRHQRRGLRPAHDHAVKREGIANIVRSTSKVIVAHEDTLTCSGTPGSPRWRRAVRIPRRAGQARRRARLPGRLLPGSREGSCRSHRTSGGDQDAGVLAAGSQWPVARREDHSCRSGYWPGYCFSVQPLVFRGTVDVLRSVNSLAPDVVGASAINRLKQTATGTTTFSTARPHGLSCRPLGAEAWTRADQRGRRVADRAERVRCGGEQLRGGRCAQQPRARADLDAGVRTGRFILRGGARLASCWVAGVERRRHARVQRTHVAHKPPNQDG